MEVWPESYAVLKCPGRTHFQVKIYTSLYSYSGICTLACMHFCTERPSKCVGRYAKVKCDPQL